MSAETHRHFSGKRLSACRKAAGMSCMELSKAIDFMVGPETLFRYEQGRGVPSVNVALRIAKALKVRPGDLIDAQG